MLYVIPGHEQAGFIVPKAAWHGDAVDHVQQPASVFPAGRQTERESPAESRIDLRQDRSAFGEERLQAQRPGGAERAADLEQVDDPGLQAGIVPERLALDRLALECPNAPSGHEVDGSSLEVEQRVNRDLRAVEDLLENRVVDQREDSVDVRAGNSVAASAAATPARLDEEAIGQATPFVSR